MYLKKTKKIGILGAGAFGTALALSYNNKFNISLFSGFDDHVEKMKKSRINEFLPDFIVPDDIEISNIKNIKKDDFSYFLWCFPIKPTLEILKSIKDIIDGIPVIICSKGISQDGSFIFDLFEGDLKSSNIGYLSGPNFAIEIANNKKSAADIACKNLNDSILFANDLSNEYFKLNPIDDVIGIQICGAIKNIIAIACGIADSLNLGQNAYASIITSAISEMKNLGIKLNAKESTFYGLCGIGDLVLTTSNDTSRNFALGRKIAIENKIEIDNNHVCEGYETLPQIIDICRKNNINLPICEAVYNILFNKSDIYTILDVI